jgi:hypothetical protein
MWKRLNRSGRQEKWWKCWEIWGYHSGVIADSNLSLDGLLQRFEEPTVSIFKVRSPFLILEGEGTTFHQNIGKPTKAAVSYYRRPESFIISEQSKIFRRLIKHHAMRANGTVEVASALTVSYFRRLCTNFSQLSSGQSAWNSCQRDKFSSKNVVFSLINSFHQRSTYIH